MTTMSDKPAAAPAVRESSSSSLPMEYRVEDVVAQVEKIQRVMQAVMKPDVHYGTVPGTRKPSLYKAGAEVLNLTFRLCPEYEIVESMKTEALIHYSVRCVLMHIPTGQRIASGLGSCNSGEKKYRHTGLADLDNTLLKMACKRALIAAVLNGTAASDMFTQDLEDLVGDGEEARQPPAPKASRGRPPAMEEPEPAAGDGSAPQMDRPAPMSGERLTEPQLRAIRSIARSKGMSPQDLDRYVADRYALALGDLDTEMARAAIMDLQKLATTATPTQPDLVGGRRGP